MEELAAAASGTPAEGVIDKPAAGGTLVVDVNDGQQLNFSFDLADVSINLSDVDLILTFPDGARIILLEFGLLSALDSIPAVHFESGPVLAKTMVAQVGQFDSSALNQETVRTSLAESKTPAEAKADAKAESSQAAQEVQAPVKPLPKDLIDNKKGNSFGEFDRSKIDDDLGAATRNKRFSEEAAGSGTSFKSGISNILPDSEISVRVFGLTRQTSEVLASGETLIRGATAQAPADTDPSHAVQAMAETIIGTTGNDIIYADGQDYAPSGTSSRALEVTLDLPFLAYTPVSLIVTGLPPRHVDPGRHPGCQWLGAGGRSDPSADLAHHAELYDPP